MSERASVTASWYGLQGRVSLKIVFCTGTPDEVNLLLLKVVSINDQHLVVVVCQNVRSKEIWHCLIARGALRNSKLILSDAAIPSSFCFGQLHSLISEQDCIPDFLRKISQSVLYTPMHAGDLCYHSDSNLGKLKLRRGAKWNDNSTLRLQTFFLK